mmetsp:Transcript_120238/g.239314  ORF Transcript_120238/g.239314 Transcript_120238/m.239314 type:complete len:141 (+) Transcript_120238:242-664(+)
MWTTVNVVFELLHVISCFRRIESSMTQVGSIRCSVQTLSISPCWEADYSTHSKLMPQTPQTFCLREASGTDSDVHKKLGSLVSFSEFWTDVLPTPSKSVVNSRATKLDLVLQRTWHTTSTLSKEEEPPLHYAMVMHDVSD